MQPLTYFLILVILTLCAAVNPGVKVRVTKKGLDYGKRVADREIAEKLRHLRANDMSGYKDGYRYSIERLRISRVTLPSSSYRLSPSRRGVTWTMRNFAIEGSAGHWEVWWKFWGMRFTLGGHLDIKFSRVGLIQTSSFRTTARGQPSMSSVGCYAWIGDLDLWFSGKLYSFILNMFRNSIEDNLIQMIRPQICREVEKYVNVHGDRKLKGIKMTTDVTPNFLLDYTLVAQPIIGHNYVEMWNKGEVTWKRNRQYSPIEAGPVATMPRNRKMLYIWITDYAVNTYLYHGHANKFFRFLLPEVHYVGNNPESSKVDISLGAASMPRAVVKHNNLALEVEFNVELRSRMPGNNVTSLLTLKMDTYLTIAARIEGKKVKGVLDFNSFNLTVTKSPNGDLTIPDYVRGALEMILTTKLAPAANVYLEEGVDLPVFGDLIFYNTDIFLHEGHALMGTDFIFT